MINEILFLKRNFLNSIKITRETVRNWYFSFLTYTRAHLSLFFLLFSLDLFFFGIIEHLSLSLLWLGSVFRRKNENMIWEGVGGRDRDLLRPQSHVFVRPCRSLFIFFPQNTKHTHIQRVNLIWRREDEREGKVL